MSCLIFVFSLLFLQNPPSSGDIPSDEIKNYMITKVNNLRARGCKCGSERMKPTTPLKWNDTLYESALSHAKEMNRYNYFAHYSLDGLDIGERLDKVGYKWVVAGENIAEGQKDFDEVLFDWIKSKSHCKMLMNPKVNEMSVAKSGRYWVQHFGRSRSNSVSHNRGR